MNKKEAQAELDALEKRKAELEAIINAPSGRWKPEPDKDFHYIHPRGIVRYFRNSGSLWSENLIALGNCYRTAEEAQQVVENRKVHFELMDLADFTPDWDDENQDKWLAGWDFNNNEMQGNLVYTHRPNSVYHKSWDDFKAAAEKVGLERVEKYLRGSVI